MRKTILAVALSLAFLHGIETQSAVLTAPGKPEIIATGMGFVEGPSVLPPTTDSPRWTRGVYVVDATQPDGIIWFVRHVRGRPGKWQLEQWVRVGKPGNNGSALGPDGWLYVTSPRQKAVLRVRREMSGDKVEWLVKASKRLPLNGPNDLVLRDNGDLYFTDPSWSQRETGAVYLRGRNGRVIKVIPNIVTPNGIGLSPDQKTLYVAKSRKNCIVRCRLRPDGTLGPPEEFFRFEAPATPDGMCIDRDGTIYQALYSGRAVVAISPRGRQLWRVQLDWDIKDRKARGFGVTNCALGPDGALYITRTNGGGKKDNGCLIRLPITRASIAGPF